MCELLFDDVQCLTSSAKRRGRLRRVAALKSHYHTKTLMDSLPASFFCRREKICLDRLLLLERRVDGISAADFNDDYDKGVCDYSFMEFRSPDPFGFLDSPVGLELPANISDDLTLVGSTHCLVFGDWENDNCEQFVVDELEVPLHSVEEQSQQQQSQLLFADALADNQQQQQLDAHDDDYYDEDYDDGDDDNDYSKGVAVHMHGIEISVADFGPGAFVDELAVGFPLRGSALSGARPSQGLALSRALFVFVARGLT